MVGGDCTQQESLWILGGQQVGELPTLSPPLSASPQKSHPSLYNLPEPHEPSGMLTAQTPSWPLSPTHSKTYWPLLSPLPQPPGTLSISPGPLTSSTTTKLLACWTLSWFVSFLLKIFSLPSTQLFSSLSSDMALLLPGRSILLTLFSPARLVLKFALFYSIWLWNPDALQILFLREGHYLNYQSSCLIQNILLPKMPFKIQTLLPKLDV